MAHIEKAQLMPRAWALFRFSIRPFTRAAFAVHLRQAWVDARNPPVTPLANLQRWITALGGEARDTVIQKLELARNAATGRYTVRHDGSAFSLRREGVEFARIAGTPGRFTFTAPDPAFAERVQAVLQGYPTLPAALAKMRAANEALHTAHAA